LPVNPTNGTDAEAPGVIAQLGAPFLRTDPGNFRTNDLPVAYMTDMCHVLDVEVPYTNTTSYIRPMQLRQQDNRTAGGIMGPIFYRNLAGTNVVQSGILNGANSEYMSGVLLFGIDNNSVMDLTKIPKVNVTVRFAPSDNFRYASFLQIPEISNTNFDLIPFVPAEAPTFTKGRVIRETPEQNGK